GRPLSRWDGVTKKLHPITSEEIPDPDAKVALYKHVQPRRASWPEAEGFLDHDERAEYFSTKASAVSRAMSSTASASLSCGQSHQARPARRSQISGAKRLRKGFA